MAVRANLEPQVGNGLVELWYATGTVNAARAGTIRHAARNHGDVAVVESRLRAHLPAEIPLLVLLGDVCRGDLLVEFDCLHTSG